MVDASAIPPGSESNTKSLIITQLAMKGEAERNCTFQCALEHMTGRLTGTVTEVNIKPEVGFFWVCGGCLVGFVFGFDDFGFVYVDAVPDYFVAQSLDGGNQVRLFCFCDFCGFG